MKLKTTKLERYWILYDVGNSAFTMLVSTLMSIYFNYFTDQAGISNADYLSYWGYATSIATIIVAVLGPTLGTFTDIKGMRKIVFSAALFIGAIGCLVLGFCWHWLWFLILYVLTKSAFSLSLVVYDSMLGDVTTPSRMDEVSSRGYAWGYIGSCIPFIVCIVFYMLYSYGLMGLEVSMILVFAVTAVWWVVCTLPLLKNYQQVHYVDSASHPVRTSLKNLGGIFKELGKNKKILFFLIAFFCYIDGVYTIIDMATSFGTSLGLNTVSLVIALLVTQIVAFPASILFGMLSRKVKPEYIIVLCIGGYCAIAIYAFFLMQEYQFWILAVAVGLFQGSIQAMSRSYYAKIIPPEKSGEYFGVYDIFGKGAAFVGTMLISVITQIVTNTVGETVTFGSLTVGAQNIGVAALAILFVLGFIFFMITIRTKSNLPEPVPEGAAEGGSADADGAENPAAEYVSADDATREADGGDLFAEDKNPEDREE